MCFHQAQESTIRKQVLEADYGALAGYARCAALHCGGRVIRNIAQVIPAFASIPQPQMENSAFVKPSVKSSTTTHTVVANDFNYRNHIISRVIGPAE